MIKSNCRYRLSAAPEGLAVTISGEIAHLILDMAEVEFVDSSGLGFIMGRYALMKEIGGNLTLRNPSAIVMKMLTMTGFDKKVKITGTVNS